MTLLKNRQTSQRLIRIQPCHLLAISNSKLWVSIASSQIINNCINSKTNSWARWIGCNNSSPIPLISKCNTMAMSNSLLYIVHNNQYKCNNLNMLSRRGVLPKLLSNPSSMGTLNRKSHYKMNLDPTLTAQSTQEANREDHTTVINILAQGRSWT